MAFRALHYVFKIPNRGEAVKFYKNVLGMEVLRHEEFVEGCKAACNGPYDGRWSKTMIGYGPEDNHFVLELTYNYGIGSYRHGNDFVGIHIYCPKVYRRIISESTLPKVKHEGFLEVNDPAGYRFFIHDKQSSSHDPVRKLELASTNIHRSIDYWSKKCGMKLLESSDKHALLSFGDGQCQLQLTLGEQPIDRGQAYGRVAFSCPRDRLAPLQDKMDKGGETVVTRLVSLDTPGKATVEVIILADPDGHEICFVGDEAFCSLSQVDPKADELLAVAMSEDYSDAWFQKRGGKKTH
uniref:Glyoxalase domain containing 4 n=2 Tax=Echinococcus granulosus TaxID=6210 RepID=A0A068W910_ECHGR|nr:glyoxalase domain containing 4 [Echinococcus granulosus]